MIVDCAHYRDGSRQSDRPISLDEAATQCLQGGFVWLGMFEPSGDELDEVRESFGLHELAVEDAKTFHLRPKVEEYETGVRRRGIERLHGPGVANSGPTRSPRR